MWLADSGMISASADSSESRRLLTIVKTNLCRGGVNKLRIAYGTARWVGQDLHFAATLHGSTSDIILGSSRVHSGRGSHAAVAVDAKIDELGYEAVSFPKMVT